MTSSREIHFATLDHFDSVPRAVCEQEKVDFSADGNGNYGLDYGELNTPVKPILSFDIRKTSGNNCPPFPDFSPKQIMTPKSKSVYRDSLRLSTRGVEGDTASNGHDYWKQGGTFTKDCMQWSLTPY
ncbi:mutanase [Penicillium mononematosum]|uniref:mutanase n=1 Tax=Penicillium mononematosum TaxID=268346 RepID=UPI002548256D|nr:mutanase [Penicillium mononematosum]KAJ6186517.1 mutanase [Penicillium mononematosum]